MDDAIAAGRWRAGGAAGSRVRVHVFVRASGRQRGSTVRGIVRVHERVVVSALVRAGRQRRQRVNQETRLG